MWEQSAIMGTRLIAWTTINILLHQLFCQELQISDVCHGSYPPQTSNVLRCNNSRIPCISEVRYYQWHDDNGCPREIAMHIVQSCCEHNDSRCYRTMHEADINELQKSCTSSVCILRAGGSEQVNPPCNRNFGGLTLSNVRSIRYTCVQGSCANGPTSSSMSTKITGLYPDKTSSAVINETTPKPLSSSTKHETADQAKSNTGAIVGGIVGGLLIIGIAVGIFIAYNRRLTRGTKADTEGTSDILEFAPHGRDRKQPIGHTNTGFNQSIVQPVKHLQRIGSGDRDDDNKGALYTTWNKGEKPVAFNRRHASCQEYDHVQGQSVQFPVIRYDDYDHVKTGSDDGYKTDTNVNATEYVHTSSHKDTYDKLHRLASSQAGEVREDTYNRLHQSTAEHSKGSDAHQNASNYDYASVHSFASHESPDITIHSQDGNNVYDLAKAFPD